MKEEEDNQKIKLQMNQQTSLRELYTFSHEKVEEQEFKCLNEECSMKFVNNGKHISIRDNQNEINSVIQVEPLQFLMTINALNEHYVCFLDEKCVQADSDITTFKIIYFDGRPAKHV